MDAADFNYQNANQDMQEFAELPDMTRARMADLKADSMVDVRAENLT